MISIGPRRLGHGPWMAVDAEDAGTGRARGRPRRTRRASATPEIDDGRRSAGRFRQRAHDGADEQVMQWSVEQGERAKRARYLLESEVGEEALLERPHPPVEAIVSVATGTHAVRS